VAARGVNDLVARVEAVVVVDIHDAGAIHADAGRVAGGEVVGLAAEDGIGVALDDIHGHGDARPRILGLGDAAGAGVKPRVILGQDEAAQVGLVVIAGNAGDVVVGRGDRAVAVAVEARNRRFDLKVGVVDWQQRVAGARGAGGAQRQGDPVVGVG